MKLNMMSYLSTALDMCLNQEGGPQSRHEDRLIYICQIILALRKHQDSKDLPKFYAVIKRMGTWKKLNNYVE